jgi:hypothetical protein
MTDDQKTIKASERNEWHSENEREPVEKGESQCLHSAPYQTFNTVAESSNDSLLNQGWVGDEPCLITMDTGASVTTISSDVAAEAPKRKRRRHYFLQAVFKEALPILKEVLMETWDGDPHTSGCSLQKSQLHILYTCYLCGLEALHALTG